MIQKLLEKFEQLSAREKLIVIGGLLIAVWSAWDKFLYQPMQQKITTGKQELASLQTQMIAQQQTGIQLETSGVSAAHSANRRQLEGLKNQYRQIQEQMLVNDKKFVPPKLMAQALNDILNRNTDLSLIKLVSLPTTTVQTAIIQDHPVYKHGFALTIAGTYFNTLNYLRALEALPWGFVWDSIEYTVTDHPLAETTLQLYTLSFEESWLGI